jgi:hypothetical protein
MKLSKELQERASYYKKTGDINLGLSMDRLSVKAKNLEDAIRNHDKIHANFGGLYADKVLREELGEGMND